jgi:hypothetical protein
MRFCLLFINTILACTSTLAATANFDDDKVGSPPDGWTTGVTGSGRAEWTIEADSTAPSKPNVLKQLGHGTYPYAAKKDVSIKNGYVEVKFKAISGKEDQAAGLIWRFKDGDNYYIARANALESNVSIYFTKNGKRNTLKYQDTEKIQANVWHTLRVEFNESKFIVSLNGKPVIEIEDKTFTDAGAVGLWTKADSVTAFDVFTYESK